MPKRMLSDGVLTSEPVNSVSLEAELFFHKLIVVCDDYGRMDARAVVLLARCYPLRLESISAPMVEGWLTDLSRVGLVQIYEVEGKRYLAISKWAEHQRIRAQHSKYPAPPPQSAAIRRELPQNAPVVRETRDEKRETRSEKTDSASAETPTRRRSLALAAYPSAFEDWWDAYPAKRGSKAKAAELHAKWIASGEDPGRLLTAAKNYAGECRRDGREARFVMHAASFLAEKAQPWANYLEARAEPIAQGPHHRDAGLDALLEARRNASGKPPPESGRFVLIPEKSSYAGRRTA